MQPACCVAAASIAAALLKHPTSRSAFAIQFQNTRLVTTIRGDVLACIDLADCVGAALQVPFSSEQHAQAMLALLAGLSPHSGTSILHVTRAVAGLALNDSSRQQFVKLGVVQQLVLVVTSSCDDAVLVEACTCMANLSFRSTPQPPI